MRNSKLYPALRWHGLIVLLLITTTINADQGQVARWESPRLRMDSSDDPKLNLTDAVTVSLWMNPGMPAKETGVCGKTQVSYCLTHHANGRIYWYISAGSNNASAPIAAGRWQHVAATFDGQQLVIYINGRKAASRETKIEKITGNGGAFTIGKVRSWPDYPPLTDYAGKLADVRVYNRALSAKEVAVQYQNNAEQYQSLEMQWTAVPGGVKRELVPSRLEGIASKSKSEQAAGYGVNDDENVATFHVDGDAPRERMMKWRKRINEKTVMYYRLRYRATGVHHAQQPYALLSVESNGKSFTLLDCATAVNDARWHEIIGKFSEKLTPQALNVALSTTADRGELSIADLSFHTSLPSTPGEAFESIDLSHLYNDKVAAAIDRVIKKYNRAIDAQWQENDRFIRPDEDQSVRNEKVAFLGQQVSRRHFFPPGRDDIIEILIGQQTAKVKLRLIAEIPPIITRYGRPPVPFHLDDAEQFCIELIYDHGPADLAFPYSLADEGYVIRRVTGDYTVPADPARTLMKLRVHNRWWDASIGIGGVVLSNQPVMAEQPPLKVEHHDKPAARRAFVRREGNNLILGNRYYEARFNVDGEFSFDRLVNRFNAAVPIVLQQAAMGIVESVKVDQREATIIVRQDALRITIKLGVDDSPQLRFDAQVHNTGTKAVAKSLRLPLLKGLRINDHDDTWLFFPKYRGVETNQNGYHDSLNDRGFPLQFYDIYNPKVGVGVAVLTNNLDRVPIEYHLSKSDDGVTASIDYSDEFHTYAPGSTTKLITTKLVFHTGDWREAMRAYKDWLATWYRHRKAADSDWFQRITLLKAEHLAVSASESINKTPPLYDRASNRYVIDEMIDATVRYWGFKPDIVSLGSWFHGKEGEMAGWGDHQVSEESTGGVEMFHALSERYRDNYDIHTSVYTLMDRASKTSEIGKQIGELVCRRRADGSLVAEESVWNVCPAHKQWQDFTVDTVKRVQREVGTDAVYMDVYSFYRGHICWSKDHGHRVPTWPNEMTFNLASRVRDALPANIPVWTEYPFDDVSSQFYDGCIAYYYLGLHSLFADSHGVSEQAPQYSDPARNVYRFALPHIKQLCFPVGNEHTLNSVNRLKSIFFNGEAIFDSTWRLFDQRTRDMLAKGVSIQRKYINCFTSHDIEMHVPTLRQHVYANRFSTAGQTVWTLYNGRYETVRGAVLAIEHQDGARYRDAWNDRELQPRIENGKAIIEMQLHPQALGCIVQDRN